MIGSGGFSTIQYNTTVKRPQEVILFGQSFSTIQYNTTVKLMRSCRSYMVCFSTIQYNTTVKQPPELCG